ncbi:c-type cytochrome [Sulfitobacter sp. MF3-043]|uniref:c-type cytochrome n=1 Tax=Sulfitobacter sediminivivens TaxID=3252902 RepID=UPI0036D8D500
MKWAAIFFALIAMVAGAWYVTQPDDSGAPTEAGNSAILPQGAIVAVAVPSAFSEQEQMGKRGFDAICASCHGTNAQGREGAGPPLVHKIYEPNHHGDMAFVLAAKNGVRSHHWRFGNMPPVKGITQADVLNIVAYVRALQRENGIK